MTSRKTRNQIAIDYARSRLPPPPREKAPTTPTLAQKIQQVLSEPPPTAHPPKPPPEPPEMPQEVALRTLPPEPPPLTPEEATAAQEGAFVRHFVRTGRDAVKAAKLAGYPNPHIEGPNLLVKPSVAKALKILSRAQLELSDVTPDRVLREIAARAFVDPTKLLNEDGSTKALHELDDDTKGALLSIEQGPYGTRFKLQDPSKYMALLVGILGMERKQVDVRHSGTVQHVNLDALSDEELTQLIDAEYTEGES